MSRDCSQKRPLITSRAYIMTAEETSADTLAATAVALVSSDQLMFVESVARAIDRYDDVGVTYSLLLVVVCVVMVAADQQARKY
ncbi:hypothetical protein F511_19002 [Dorcoceras hygrometricum]|uniref:Uncharacterized protein n=1 Tax=Dorcoceras hygrometricum TaxID=472368 RepID=A0A2Z7CEW4_9LAMI|nr:hypothetical protein F511_19002 [Dorcoceras hygrometricum]